MIDTSATNQTDFESLRIGLLNTYTSQAIAHVGLFATFVVGLAVIVYQLKFGTSFEDNNRIIRIIIFYVPIALLLGAIVYYMFRIVFWSSLSTIVLTINPPQQAINGSEILWIQNQTVSSFVNSHGIASIAYSINQHQFGFLSFGFFSICIFLYLFGFDYFYSWRIKFYKLRTKGGISQDWAQAMYYKKNIMLWVLF